MYRRFFHVSPFLLKTKGLGRRVEAFRSRLRFRAFRALSLLALHEVHRGRCKRARLCDLSEYGLSSQWQTETNFCRFAHTGITAYQFARVTAKITAEDRLSHLALYLVDHCGNSFVGERD